MLQKLNFKLAIMIVSLTSMTQLVSCSPSVDLAEQGVTTLQGEAYPAPKVVKQIETEIELLEGVLQQDNLSELERNSAEDRLIEVKILATKVLAPTPSAAEVAKAYEVEQTRIAESEQVVIATPTIELGILPKTSIYYEVNYYRLQAGSLKN